MTSHEAIRALTICNNMRIQYILATYKNIGEIIWLFCLYVVSDHMNICNIKCLSGN